MSVSTPSAISPWELPGEPVWRFTVEQYHEMIRAGILTDDDPIELLDGWLVTKMPKNPAHRSATIATQEALAAMLPPGWSAWSQEAITLPSSEPEPDVLVVRGDRHRYPDRNPGPDDVALVVEVADSTLRRDRLLKKRLYASARVPAYWIINLLDGRLETYADPTGPSDEPDYRLRRDYGPDAAVPLLLDAREVGRIAVRDLLR